MKKNNNFDNQNGNQNNSPAVPYGQPYRADPDWQKRQAKPSGDSVAASEPNNIDKTIDPKPYQPIKRSSETPGQPAYGAPVNNPAQYQQPAQRGQQPGQPNYGAPAGNPAQYQQPAQRGQQPGQPAYGAPANNPAQYQQPAQRGQQPGQPAYGAPANNPAQYQQPAQRGQQPGQPQPPQYPQARNPQYARQTYGAQPEVYNPAAGRNSGRQSAGAPIMPVQRNQPPQQPPYNGNSYNHRPAGAYNPNGPVGPTQPYGGNPRSQGPGGPNGPYNPNAAYIPNGPYNPNAAYNPNGPAGPTPPNGGNMRNQGPYNPNGPGRPNGKPPKKKSKKKALWITLAILAVILLIIASIYGYYIKKYNDEVLVTQDYVDDWDDVDGSGNQIIKVPRKDKNVENILLLGIDGNSLEANGNRSDSMMVVSINSKEKTIRIASLMRDIWAYYPDSGKYDKLNHAHAKGGPSQTVNIVNHNFGLDIQKFIVTDFNGMQSLIDVLGGITLDITDAEAGQINGINAGGKITLNGQQALDYARIRKIDSDFSRVERQRNVIMAMLNEIKGESFQTQIETVNESMQFVRSNIPGNALTGDLMSLVLSSSSGIEQLTVPEDGMYTVNSSGTWYMELDWERQKTSLHEFLYGNK